MLTAVLVFLYGVASIYTFHSYRSGLATALHAANVPDDMIMLICRWMCPESLHVYRRMGTREHEGHITRASTVSIDLIQATNVVHVDCDEGYAQLVSDLQGARGRDAQRDFDAAVAAVRLGAKDYYAARGSTSRQTPASPSRRPAAARAPAAAPSPPAPPAVVPMGPPNLGEVSGPLRPGTDVFVPKEIWPAYECNEHAGLGWAASVVSATKYTCVVSFTFACTPDGTPYENERLATSALKLLI